MRTYSDPGRARSLLEEHARLARENPDDESALDVFHVVKIASFHNSLGDCLDADCIRKFLSHAGIFTSPPEDYGVSRIRVVETGFFKSEFPLLDGDFDERILGVIIGIDPMALRFAVFGKLPNRFEAWAVAGPASATRAAMDRLRALHKLEKRYWEHRKERKP